MKVAKKWQIMQLFLFSILCTQNIFAATFISVKPNQLSYENGDILIFTVVMDDPTVKVTMDASVLDPYFRAQDVRYKYTAGNNTHILIYPLSFVNNQPTGTYPVLLNAYNPITKVSDALTYNVERKALSVVNANVDPGNLIIKVKKTTTNIVDVSEGRVKICFSDGKCIDQSKAWYDQANAPLPDYEKAIDEKLTSLDNKITDSNNMIKTSTGEVKAYVDSSNTQLAQAITKFDNTVQTLGTVMTNQTQQTQDALQRATYVSVGGIVAVFLLTGIILYVLYLRYSTSWYYW